VWTKLSLGVTGIPSAHVVATVPALDRQVLEAPDGVEPLVNITVLQTVPFHLGTAPYDCFSLPSIQAPSRQ
jgi:hypothetical protein